MKARTLRTAAVSIVSLFAAATLAVAPASATLDAPVSGQARGPVMCC